MHAVTIMLASILRSG